MKSADDADVEGRERVGAVGELRHLGWVLLGDGGGAPDREAE